MQLSGHLYQLQFPNAHRHNRPLTFFIPLFLLRLHQLLIQNVLGLTDNSIIHVGDLRGTLPVQHVVLPQIHFDNEGVLYLLGEHQVLLLLMRHVIEISSAVGLIEEVRVFIGLILNVFFGGLLARGFILFRDFGGCLTFLNFFLTNWDQSWGWWRYFSSVCSTLIIASNHYSLRWWGWNFFPLTWSSLFNLDTHAFSITPAWFHWLFLAFTLHGWPQRDF